MLNNALSVCSIYIILSFSAKAENLGPKGVIGRYRALLTAKGALYLPLAPYCLRFSAFAENDSLMGRGESWRGRSARLKWNDGDARPDARLTGRTTACSGLDILHQREEDGLRMGTA